MRVNGQPDHSELEFNDAPAQRQPVTEMTLREWMNKYGAIRQELFLPVARSLTSSLWELHQRQTLHLDLRPERILVHPDEQQAGLMDSGYAVHRSENGYTRSPGLGMSEAELPYCSPENTGRMQRTVDERSDLYSLGIIFYEMLSGRLPYLADNPLEWVYRHLAQSPPPLPDAQSDGLEAIIRKLLEKNPDNRYPHAGFLLADLDKIGHARDPFSFEPEFHGREQEISVLTQTFYSVCFGSNEMVYVSGEAGIGKTSLLDEMFRKQQHTRDFFYITGKFEQISKESPYHPIIQAFRGLMRHLLGQRKDRTERWKHQLREALGANANIITAIIPEAERIVGTVPPAEELPANEAKKRFLYVFRKFVQALASKEHPLVLFIDDLQWADTSSLELLRALLCDPECQYLMIVCAYRPNETDRSRLPGYEPDGSIADQAMVRHIHLSPLTPEQMNRIVMGTLHSPADATLSLTELLYHASGGNPFHFKQILLRLQDDKSLEYNLEKRCWQWNLGQIIGQEPSYAIHDLMEHRLDRLPSDAQELLQIAACMGSTFNPHWIAGVVHREKEALHAAWTAIEAEGWILPVEGEAFRFAHDSIQKLIYSRIDDPVKQAIHKRIGRCMGKEAEGQSELLFDMVNHLNRGSQTITDEEEQLHLAKLNLDAGQRAKSSSAYDVALGYFKKGVELLTALDWDREFELCFEMHAQKAECEYLCGHSNESEGEIAYLLGLARNPVQLSRVQMIRIMQFINQGKYLEGTALGLESLKELQINISPDPGRFTLILEGLRIELLLRKQYDQLARLEEMSDVERIAAMNLIFAITPSTFFTNKDVYFLLMCRAIQLSLAHGNTPASAAVYSAYGMLLAIALGKPDKGYAIGKVGMELSERYAIASMKSRTYTIFGGVLCQFAGDAREGDAYLSQALRYGMDSGDYIFASYAMGAHINSLYTRASLSELSRTISDYMVILDTTKDEFVKQNFRLYQQVTLALQGRTAAPDSFESNGFDENEFLNRIRQEETSATTLFQYDTYKTQLCYLLGSYEEALGWARQAMSYEAYATHLPHLPECLFYESLSLAAVSAPAGCKDPKKRQIHRNIRRFNQQWTRWSPLNYKSRQYLLEAELARVSGKPASAEEGYDKALREAREQGDVQVTSLAGELAALHYWRSGKKKTALFYLQLALEGYKQWEVRIKITELERRMQDWQQHEGADLPVKEPMPKPAAPGAGEHEAALTAASDRNGSSSIDSVDLAVILRTAQAITNPTNVDAILADILSTIMKYAAATKGALLTGRQDMLYIQVYADAEAQAQTSPMELIDSALLPEGIIRYVFHTQEEVVYSGDEESWLIHNPYFAKHRPQSALCIPIAVHGTMLGVLYLENKLASGVFTTDRLTVLQAMASHGVLMCVLQGFPEQSLSGSGLEEDPRPAPGVMEEPLTDRELEVLALLAAGLSNKEIADHLVIAVSTVKVHVKNIFAKLKVNRRTKAIAQAKELRLLEENG
ncbi:AAA family ATPase [Paenibacillus rigui]|uniref:PAS sensor protein n=1 Tax=Paenibacillus rigui TaxID=554312 RepID=A0A229UH00_9BACL|nr:AAA family ATPase [Paenibacillus rigui]OXM82662.1 PAS sensor protein [Paenibacillus rigui]